MHVYYAIESPIPPPVIMPPSPMISAMFDPQDFFLPKEILPHHTSHTCHKERIEDILNHLDELSLDYIKEMKGHVAGQVIIQQDFDKLKTELQEARAQIAELQRKQMRHNDKIGLACFRISTLELITKDIQRTSTSAAPAMNQAAIQQLIDDHVATALEAQAANMANTDNTNRNPELRETLAVRKLFSPSNYTEDCKVKFATGTLTEDALSWWNSYAKPIRIEQADKIIWSELKRLLTNKYFPRTEVKKIKDEFYNLVVKGNDLKTYDRRF
uniref:Reverse transcriptase domain-containing protein n=1 Tax=Tanacetum cinerariifolium TaxID=118510 RepID=A0A6L2LIV9_TANCI|nr:reverse transcriptase domain-containing protein [Tanacetum cinerariifolium]